MFVDAEHARDLQGEQLAVFNLVHVIVVAREGAVGFAEIAA